MDCDWKVDTINFPNCCSTSFNLLLNLIVVVQVSTDLQSVDLDCVLTDKAKNSQAHKLR